MKGYDDKDNDDYNDNNDDFYGQNQKRLTLKTAIAFKDQNYPDLIFLIPKKNRWLMNYSNKSISASVYLIRGDPLLSLHLDVGTELSLLPRKITSKAMSKYYLDNPVVMVVDTIDFALSARQASLTLSRYNNY